MATWNDVRAVRTGRADDAELPQRVDLRMADGSVVQGAGMTVGDAALRVFRMAGLYQGFSKTELAQEIFWHFEASQCWRNLIRELEAS